MNKLSYNIDLKIGDVILTGKWKNQREIVEKFGTSDIGQPTINGKSLLNLRIEKLLPNSKKSSQTLAAELDKVKTAAFDDEFQKLSAEGRVYPSKEQKTELDAATDNVHEELEAATAPVLQYPRDHMSIKQAAFIDELNKIADEVTYQDMDKKSKKNKEQISAVEPEDISHGSGETRSYD